MEGWTEEEIRNKALMAPCGLYCGACGVYIATRDGNEKFRAIMARNFGSKLEETKCMGCMQPDTADKLFGRCQTCPIRKCVNLKSYYSCHQCELWPCDKIENGNLANILPSQIEKTVLKVRKRSIPEWRAKVAEYGDENGSVEWVRAECERYHCPSCGKPLFRGAQHCRACKKPVADELDGVI